MSSQPKSKPSAPSELIQGLTVALANTYALTVKTHGAHWNVVGSEFFGIHAAFEKQYTDLFEAADQLAERLRVLGSVTPGGIAELAKLSTLSPAPTSRQALDLVKVIYDDRVIVAAQLGQTLELAKKAEDEATADLLITHIEEHEKTAWMLLATLGK